MDLVARHGFCRRQVWRRLHVGEGQRLKAEREPELEAKLAELFTPRAPPERTELELARGETLAERRRATLSALARGQPVQSGILAAEVRVAGRSVWLWGRARYLKPRGGGQVDIVDPGKPSELVWARLELAGLLLERSGSFFPAKLVAGRETESRPYDAAVRARTLEALRGVVELASPEAAEPWAPIGSWCKNCGHKPYCFPLADAERDLSLVSGLPRQTAHALRERGVTTVGELASEDVTDLAAEPYSADTRLGRGRAARLIDRAQAHRASQPLRRPGHRRLHDELAGKMPVAFDVETLPGSHTVVLWGLKAEGEESPTIVDAGCEADWDHRGWEGFLHAVEGLHQRYGPLRLCHFGRFETTVSGRYRQGYGDRSAGTGLGDLLLDVWLHVSRALALPVTGYTQKDVEAYLGFQRPSAGKDGVWASAQLSLCQAGEAADEDRARRVGEVAAYLDDDLAGLLHVVRRTLEIEDAPLTPGMASAEEG